MKSGDKYQNGPLQNSNKGKQIGFLNDIKKICKKSLNKKENVF